jgi:outer membrane biosynthesis protein TonB
MTAATFRTLIIIAAAVIAAPGARAAQALLKPSEQKEQPKPKPEEATRPATGAGGDETKPKAAMMIEQDAPSTAEGQPPVPVGEEKAAIGSYIRDQTTEVKRCYERRVEDKPTLAGKLYAIFYIGPNGRVIGATTQGLQDNELSACILKIVRKWEFEKPKSGGKLMVKYPFVFTPIASRQ